MQSWSKGEFDSHTTTKIKIMYEVLEHWKQYKLEKEAKNLQRKINKEFQLKEKVDELDSFMWKLYHKNGTTEY